MAKDEPAIEAEGEDLDVEQTDAAEKAEESKDTGKGKEAPADEAEEQPDPDLIDAIAEGVQGDVTANDDATALDETEPEPDEGAEEAAGDSEPAESTDSSKAQTKTEEQPEEPKTVEDPGDFKPGDYSFEISTTDGKTHKITTPEDAEAFAALLDNEEGLITATQFLKFNQKASTMEVGITGDKRAYEATQEAFKAEEAVRNTEQETIAQWDKEINYMAEKGELPKISQQLAVADWADPEVAKDPAVKARVELLQWTDTENNRRIEAGLEPIRSMLDAHNAMQLESMRSDEKSAAETDRQTRQKRGSMVGSRASSEPIATESKDVVGAGGTLDDLVSEFQLS